MLLTVLNMTREFVSLKLGLHMMWVHGTVPQDLTGRAMRDVGKIFLLVPTHD